MKKFDISVIIAAYNEEDIIESSTGNVLKTLNERGNINWELILVDDGSTDRTGEILDEISKNHPGVRVFHFWRNFGQGRALIKGFRESRGEIIITLDADLSYSPEYIWKLYDAIVRENVEIVLASPYMKGGSVRNVPYHRLILSKIANKYLSSLSNYNLFTFTSVVRAYRRVVVDSIYLTSNGSEALIEILMKANMLGFRTLEIPAELNWSNDKNKNGVRRSKMKILKSINLYLRMGWLIRPAYIFVITGGLMILAGIYILSWLSLRLYTYLQSYLKVEESFNWALSYALKDLYHNWQYSLFFSGGFIIIGLQLLIFALIFIQNKYHHDELYRLMQEIHKLSKKK